MNNIIVSFLFFCCAVNSAFAKDSRYFGSCFPEESSVTQSFVIDNRKNESFSQSLSKLYKNSDVIGARISRYEKVGGDMHVVQKTQIHPIIGHQGLAIQYKGVERFFWGSLNKNDEKTSGNYVLRYKINDAIIADLTILKIFSDINTSQSTTPAVSADGKYLIAKMTRSNEHEIRIFDLNVFSSAGDYAEKFHKKFTVKRDKSEKSPKALQSLASDGERIYLLNGSFNVGDSNFIDVYTFDGVLLNRIKVDHGENDAAEIDSGIHYEPESLTWLINTNVSRPELILQIAAGDKGKRKCLLYKVNEIGY